MARGSWAELTPVAPGGGGCGSLWRRYGAEFIKEYVDHTTTADELNIGEFWVSRVGSAVVTATCATHPCGA